MSDTCLSFYEHYPIPRLPVHLLHLVCPQTCAAIIKTENQSNPAANFDLCHTCKQKSGVELLDMSKNIKYDENEKF